MLRFVTSGANGSHGSRGYGGSYPGGDGGRGGDGTNGGDAQPINIKLTYGSGACYAQGTHRGTLACAPSSVLFLAARGGDGGHGGRGGDGGAGYSGSDGRDATQYSSGTNGGNGGPGGDGGNGGSGGDGGDGGHIRVNADDADMDLFMLLEARPDVAGGAGGPGGSGGSGGSGGPGGRGGAGCSWTETRNGQTFYKSNPGGYSGASGVSGSCGRGGRTGANGNDGTFFEVVRFSGGQEVQYKWRYVANIGNRHAFYDDTTQDGVFEPGEDCRCVYRVANTGPMPTPKVQRLLTSIFANDWITNPSTTNVSRHLLPVGEVSDLTGPILFVLKDITEAVPNTIFKATTDAEWNVMVERVNKYFNKAELGPGVRLTIQHPLRMSKTHGAASIARHELAPLTICLHNLSTRAWGNDKGRVIRMRLTLVHDVASMKPFDDAGIARLVDYKGNAIPYLDVPVSCIHPRTNTVPGTFVQFGPNALLYNKVNLAVSLHFGHVRNFLQERRIQRMSTTVQLAEYYSRKAGTNLVIVTTHKTSRESYVQWNLFAPRGGYIANFWNATMHDGISLEQTVGGSSLAVDVTGGTIVVENNDPEFLTALRTERNADRENAFDTLSSREISYAMRERHIGFSVLGKGVDVRKKLLPSDAQLVPIPSADELDGFFRVRLLRDTEYWISRLNAVPLRQGNRETAEGAVPEGREDYKQLCDDLVKGFQLSKNVAWHLLLGYAVTKGGDELLQTVVQRPETFQERLTWMLDWYFPVKTKTLAPLMEFAQGLKDDPLQASFMQQLVAYFGGPEPEHSNRYRYVYVNARIHELQTGSESAVAAFMFDAAKALHAEVAAIRPTWKFTVIWEPAAHIVIGNIARTAFQLPGFRDVVFQPALKDEWFRSRYCVGRLKLARAGNRTGTVIQHIPLRNDTTISRSTIASPAVLYGTLRATPFSRRMEIMSNNDMLKPKSSEETCDDGFSSRLSQRFASRDVEMYSSSGNFLLHDGDASLPNYGGTSSDATPIPLYSTVIATVLSDLVEEQIAVRRHLWSGKVREPTLLEHMPLLCSFIVSGYLVRPSETHAFSAFRAVAVRFFHVLERWVPWSDYLMVARRQRLATTAACSALLPFLLRLFGHEKEILYGALKKIGKEVKNLTTSALIHAYASGCWFEKSLSRSSQNQDLFAKCLSASMMEGIRAREAPAQIVVDRWVLNSSRDRKTMHHKLRTEFGPDGEVSSTTSRDALNARLSFLSCPMQHTPSARVPNSKLTTCSICAECDADAMNRGGGCEPCNWWVCRHCIQVAEQRQWTPKFDGPPMDEDQAGV